MDYMEYKNSTKRIMFSDLFDTIVTNGGALPDFIKLERIAPSSKRSLFEPEDTQTLALISGNKELYWKRMKSGVNTDKLSRYVSIPIKDGEKTKPFSETTFVEKFKISVAYIEPMPKWTDLGACFKSIMWDSWLEASDRKAENPVDFLKLVSVEKHNAIDFIRIGEVLNFINFSKEIGEANGPLLRPPNTESWESIQALKEVLGEKINIFTATFKELPKDIDVKNDFITFSPKDLEK